MMQVNNGLTSNMSIFFHPDTPLFVRSNSDSGLAPPPETKATPPPVANSNGSPEPVSIVTLALKPRCGVISC